MNVAGLRLELGGNLLDSEAGFSGALEQFDDCGFQGTLGRQVDFGLATWLVPGRGGRFIRLEAGQFSVDFGDLGLKGFLLFHELNDPVEVGDGDLRPVHVAEV